MIFEEFLCHSVFFSYMMSIFLDRLHNKSCINIFSGQCLHNKAFSYYSITAIEWSNQVGNILNQPESYLKRQSRERNQFDKYTPLWMNQLMAFCDKNLSIQWDKVSLCRRIAYNWRSHSCIWTHCSAINTHIQLCHNTVSKNLNITVIY